MNTTEPQLCLTVCTTLPPAAAGCPGHGARPGLSRGDPSLLTCGPVMTARILSVRFSSCRTKMAAALSMGSAIRPPGCMSATSFISRRILARDAPVSWSASRAIYSAVQRSKVRQYDNSSALVSSLQGRRSYVHAKGQSLRGMYRTVDATHCGKTGHPSVALSR